MPLYSSPSTSTAYAGLYLPGPYSTHSSILSSSYRSPVVIPKTIPRYPRSYTPHLATITESGVISPLRGKFSPQLLLQHHSSPATYTIAKPIKINTADIDVSVNKYRKYDRRAQEVKKSPEKLVRSTEKLKSPSPPAIPATKLTSVSTTPPTTSTDVKNGEEATDDGDFKPIRRDRALVRLHTVHKKDSPRKNLLQNGSGSGNEGAKSWRENFYEDMKPGEKQRAKKTPGEILVDKFLIRTEEEERRLQSEGRKLPRRMSGKNNFHEICRAISSDNINEDLNPGQPEEITRRQSKQLSEEDIFKQIRRNSAEILKENVEILEDMLRQENLLEDENNNNMSEQLTETEKPKKKKIVKKKSNEKLTLDAGLGDGNKSNLQRRATQKKIRRTSTDSSLLSDISVDEDVEKAFQEAIRDISQGQVEVEEIRIRPKPKITATVDIVESPSPSWKAKAVIDNVNVEIVESPTAKKPKKFKYNVTVEEVHEVPESNKHLPELKLSLTHSALAMKREKSKSPQPTTPEEKKIDSTKKMSDFSFKMNERLMDKILEVPIDKSPKENKIETPKAKVLPKVEAPKPQSPKMNKFELSKTSSSPKVLENMRKPSGLGKLAPKEENMSGENFWEKIGTRESVTFDQRRKKLQEKRKAVLIQEEDEEGEATVKPITVNKLNEMLKTPKVEETKPNVEKVDKIEINKSKLEETKSKIEETKRQIAEMKSKAEAKVVAKPPEDVKPKPEVKPEVNAKLPEIKPKVPEKLIDTKPKVVPILKKTVSIVEEKIIEKPKLTTVEQSKLSEVKPEVNAKLPEIKPKVPEKLVDTKPKVVPILNKAAPIVEEKVIEKPKLIVEQSKLPDVKPEVKTKLPETTPKVDDNKCKVNGMNKIVPEKFVDIKPKVVEEKKSLDETPPPSVKKPQEKVVVPVLKKIEEKVLPQVEKSKPLEAEVKVKEEPKVLKPKLPKEKSVEKKSEVPPVKKILVNNVMKDVQQNGKLGRIEPPPPKVEPPVLEPERPKLVIEKSEDKPKLTKEKSLEKPLEKPPVTKQKSEDKPKLTKDKSLEEKEKDANKEQKPRLKKEKSLDKEDVKSKLTKDLKLDLKLPAEKNKLTPEAEPEIKSSKIEEPASVVSKKKIISKRSLVNKSGIDDPDLEVFKPPTPPMARTPSPPKFVPLQSNRLSAFMNPLLKRADFDEKGARILYARPKTIRHRHYPRPRHSQIQQEKPKDDDDEDDDDEEEEEEESEEVAVAEVESSSEEESGSEDDDDEESDDEDDDDVDYEALNDVWGYGSVGASTSSVDSGFHSGTKGRSKDCDVNCHRKCEKLTANLCGVNQKLIVEAIESVKGVKRGCTERDSPTSNPAHNPALRIDPNELAEEYPHSSTFAGFKRSGRITPPATTIPKFCKYNVEDFNFLKVLGKGSFGKVLLAELKNSEYYYAIKCLKKDVVLEDDDVECTLIERKVLALGTKHPYLCHLLCTFQTDSHLFFVMEYLNGGDLMFHIQQSGRFQEPRARFYAAEIVSGLKFLHGKGIVYRDLKLDNILLDFDGHVRIADFGMCKLQIFLDRMADTFCGTPDYMAPEIIKGQHYNQNVDWWSFGVLLYEMLIGQSPFSGCDEDELFWSICNERPVLPKFLSRESCSVLSLLLEKDGAKRLGNKFCEQGDIQDQPFFRPIDWEALNLRQLEPPFRPNLLHPLDTQYFDRTFTAERAKLTPIEADILQSMDQTQFQGFSYTNPNATDR